jgi:hypothetical protein
MMKSTTRWKTVLVASLIGLYLGQLQAAPPALSFNAPKAFSAFTYVPEEVGITPVAGDFNGDGKQDLAAMNDLALTVLLGNGDGSFQPPLVTYPAGAQYYGMIAGDFNGDGRLDLALGGEVSIGSFGIQIPLGNGDGTFQPLPPVLGPDVPLLAGDFNGDGILDLAVCGGATVQILFGNGDGTFQAPIVYSVVGGYVGGLTTADFNGDGILDLAVISCDAYCQPSYLSILLGNSDGTFQPPISSSEALTACSTGFNGCVAPGDFNGDGKTDLALCGADNTVLIQLGNGDGTFATPVSYPVTGAAGVAVGDFNHDGRLDLAVNNSGLSILFGKGDGTFAAQIFYSSGGGGGILSAISLADFNGDGYEDVAIGNAFTISILLNNRKGLFQHPVQYPVEKSPTAVAVGDLNGDGNQDLVVANTGSNTVSILLGDGSSKFQPAMNYPVGKEPVSIVVADFNGDGKPDLAVANSGDSTVSILLGVGNGTFQPAINYASGEALAVAVGDFNGDGKLDLATANTDQSSECYFYPLNCPATVSILLGNGDGTFQGPRTITVGKGGASALSVADFNGDGKADLAVVLGFASNVAILLGKGNATFQPPVDYIVGVYPDAVAVADLNGDGIPDLAVANPGSGPSGLACPSPCVSVLLGNGNGTFQPQVTYSTGGAQALAFGDFNGDGKMDLVVSIGDAVSILAGNGDGTLQSGVDFVVGPSANGLAVGDFNRHGKPDLAVADSGDNAVAVLTNTSRLR